MARKSVLHRRRKRLVARNMACCEVLSNQTVFVAYTADLAALSTSRSPSAAGSLQRFAIRSNFRSSAFLVFEAYHLHWRAFSLHSAIVAVIAALRLGHPGASHATMGRSAEPGDVDGLWAYVKAGGKQ
jgi:hypothetical protein